MLLKINLEPIKQSKEGKFAILFERFSLKKSRRYSLILNLNNSKVS